MKLYIGEKEVGEFKDTEYECFYTKAVYTKNHIIYLDIFNELRFKYHTVFWNYGFLKNEINAIDLAIKFKNIFGTLETLDELIDEKILVFL